MTHPPAYLPLDQPPRDQAAWDAAAATFETNQLAQIQTVADKWITTVTSLIGVFSAVAIVGGTSRIADLTSASLKTAVVILVVVAGALAVTSLYTASAAAAGPTPTVDRNFRTDGYRSWVFDTTLETIPKLKKARKLGMGAVVVVALVAVISLVDAAEPAPSKDAQTAVVLMKDGSALCGKLTTNGAGSVSVASRPITDSTQVVVVDHC